MEIAFYTPITLYCMSVKKGKNFAIFGHVKNMKQENVSCRYIYWMPDALNDHFLRIVIPPAEDPAASLYILLTIVAAPLKGFRFSTVILEVTHFKSQARGECGVPHRIVTKALLGIVPFLSRLFNFLLANGIFPLTWKRTWISSFIVIWLSANNFAMLPFQGSGKIGIDSSCKLHGYCKKILDPFQTGFGKYHNKAREIELLLKCCNFILVGQL